MTSNARKFMTAGVAVAAVATAGMVAFGDRLEKPICPPARVEYALLAQTSLSDRDMAAAAAAQVGAALAERAATRCAAITTAVTTNRPEADLVTSRKQLDPGADRAPDRRPYVHDMEKVARAFVRRTFVTKLDATRATRFSPVLGTLVQLGKQYQAARIRPTTIVFISDGLALEPGPRGWIDLYRPAPSDEARRLTAFRQELEPLRGATVVILGFGANTTGPERVQHAEDALRAALEAAGVRLVVTRSLTLPDWV